MICTPKFLKEEFNYIENSFAQLQYPKFLRNMSK